MNFNSTFDIGEMVILKHDNDKAKRMITGISFRTQNNYSYCLACGDKETWHYEHEIERHNSETKKMGFAQ